jgi:hypothetical protein
MANHSTGEEIGSSLYPGQAYLQWAHLMINYDLPWNPNRPEQRFGRIHRIGQRYDTARFYCHWQTCNP